MASVLLERPRAGMRHGRLGTAARRIPVRPVHAVPAAVVLALGLVELARNVPLWYDEEYTRLAAGVPLPTLLAGVANRTGVIHYLMDVPPSFNAPYYVLMHGWAAVFGTSPFALRLPTVLAAAVAVALFAELARRIGGRGAGWATGLLMATGALFLDEMTQARPYGLALCALGVSALAIERWRRTGAGMLPAAIAGGIAALLHWFAIPVIVSFAVAAVASGAGSGGRRAGIRTALALVAGCLPALALIAWSFAGGAQGAPSPPSVGWQLPWTALVDWTGGLRALAAVLGVLAVVGLVASRDRLLIAWTILPLAVITALELVRAVYFPRYLLFTLAGILVAAGVGIAALARVRIPRGAPRPVHLLPRVAAVALTAGVVAASLQGAAPLFRDTVREPGPQAIAYLATHQTAGEPIVTADGRVSLDLETSLPAAPSLASDLVLPPTLFTNQTASRTVWLVRVVLHSHSKPVMPAEQRLIDAGWTLTSSTLLHGSNADLRIERWTR